MTKSFSKLIVMLTYNDKTVENALEIFNECKNLDVDFWGIKTDPLPLEKMSEFVQAVHAINKIAVFESVCYTEEEGISDARKAAHCKCDILMGTVFSNTINSYCKENGIKYMPFIGRPSLVPSILNGTPEEIAADINSAITNGTFGVDFLAYRHTKNAKTILDQVLTSNNKTNICIAGSVDSFKKLDQIKKLNASFFTIGSAFFNKRFGNSIPEQIEKVINYIKS